MTWRFRHFGMTVSLAMLSVFSLIVVIGVAAWAKYTNSTADATLPPSPFNEQRAFEDLERFAALGPRPPGSDAHDWAYLLIHLSLLGAGVDVHNVEFDSFKSSTPVGEIEMTNVIAKIPGARPEMVILGGHYDTKRMKMRFVGANDGASSTAFLIEMAHVLAQRRNRFTYWIVLFDGKEPLEDGSSSDGLYGSRHFVQTLTAEQVKRIRAMFNVDMIGDRNLHIHRESHSDAQLTDLIFRDAQDLGYGRYFLERPLSVEDDHMPFVRAGIPAVELISLDYGPFNIFWHTPLDTVGKCSAVSLGIVGRVLLDALEDLESGRTPKPLLAFLESGRTGVFRASAQ
ncbi:MAG TPA: M28 family metallopeptidase [Terriglobales bacterium]|nr:M28 family metallopeptidase [Terriglobales bacterium]